MWFFYYFPYMTQKRSLLLATSPALVFLFASCGDFTSTLLHEESVPQTIEIHDIGHIDFPGAAGRWIMSKNVVQFLLATKRVENTCSIVEPLDTKSDKNQKWTFAPRPPVVSFWRIHQDDATDKANFVEEISGIFKDLIITRNHFQPKEVLKKFAYLTQEHLDRVQITYPKFSFLKENQLAAQLKASNLLINLLMDPKPMNDDSCKVELSYWCNDKDSDLCKGTSEKSPRTYDAEDGFGIYMGESVAWALVSDFKIRKSELVMDLQIDSFQFQTFKHNISE
jgi:hypothetical protein